MYKSQLKEFCDKAGFETPVYEYSKEGAAHAPSFRATVVVHGVKYASSQEFANLKAAEHAAAKVALRALLKTSAGAAVHFGPVEKSGLCKSLLQEYAQKSGLPVPVYHTMETGEGLSRAFYSTVEIGGMLYQGSAAKSKKETEILAAQKAYLSIYGKRKGKNKSGNRKKKWKGRKA